MNTDAFTNPRTVRLFSYGRHALAAGLRALGIGKGDAVLLPELICRDLLASLHSVGALPVYYPVDRRLQPALPVVQWPSARAVLAVNYFGFAQDLAPFEAYRARSGARIIEDNAHGFLSRDPQGQCLGLRGEVGIFSFRKSLPWPGGAALVIGTGTEGAGLSLPAPLPEVRSPFSAAQALRAWGASGAPWRRRTVATMARVKRASHRLLSAHAHGPATAQADTLAEQHLPGRPEPFAGLHAHLIGVDATAEVARRRHLYLALEARVRALGLPPAPPGAPASSPVPMLEPVFAALPAHCAPYGLPVYASRAEVLHGLAQEAGLDCIAWPDLPGALSAAAPAHYRQLHVINFL